VKAVLTVSLDTEVGACLYAYNGHFVAVKFATCTAYIKLTFNLSGKF
jgi:hypothetical protein